MSATFEPRQVESGALRRWARQAAGLLTRGTLAWVVCGVVFLGLAGLAANSWFGVALVGVWSHVHFQLMANRADRGALSLLGLPGYFGASLLELVLHTRRTPVTAITNVIVASLGPFLVGLNPFQANGAVYSGVSLFGPPDLAAFGTGLMLGGFLLSAGMGFMTHGFMLSRITEAPFIQLMTLTAATRRKNGALGMAFDVLLITLFTLGMLVPPMLALVAAFAGAWSYVSFRDIYMHQDGNFEPARAPAAVPTTA